ncbi:MAG: histidine phosphatase family protein [Hungatella sp.]|jgi:hypothetical protein|nr:histidine phosphatase family protein [Hungatella sp.]
MKKVTFYYVRHEETLFNVLNRMQGWCDSPLTEKGVSHAKEARFLLSPTGRRGCGCRKSCWGLTAGRMDGVWRLEHVPGQTDEEVGWLYTAFQG